jgi:hypothetical protein
MTLYEIINKYRASFVIDEIIPQGSGYSKQVCVRFDRLGQYIINTPDISKTEPLNCSDSSMPAHA